jgi:hypothetical protein
VYCTGLTNWSECVSWLRESLLHLSTTMRARSINSIRTVVAVALIAAAAPAQSAMYRWIEQDGAVMYSDQLPLDSSKVRALTVMHAPAPPSTYEKRSQELIDAERGRSSDSAAAGREVQPTPGIGRDTDVGTRGLYGHDPELQPRTSGSTEPQGAARLSGLRPSQPEAARDPCLRSSDPRCHEKNRDAYVPYLGYSPSARAARSPDLLSGIGATSGVSASGAIGGSTGTAAPSGPPRRAQPWQLRNTLKDAKDLK